METLVSFFGGQIGRALSLSKIPTVINGDNVFQEGDPEILAILDEMVGKLILPGSGLDGLEHLEELLTLAESGKSCLLFPEHYSNLDLSIISLMARKAGGRGSDVGNSIIAIAGMKLNEDNPAVAAFTGAYTKIVIYPSRYLSGLDANEKKAEFIRSTMINRAALKVINEQKVKGKMILIFPSGTRYRPWDPGSKKGVREIDSYIRSFDYMCLVALNGEILHIQKTDMINDEVSKDLVRVTVSPVISCAEFREKAMASISEDEDKKQVVCDAIMAELEKMHTAAEEKRQLLLKA
jgi:1-acyl-sn-glycerol-3-phosphate acyltransferase